MPPIMRLTHYKSSANHAFDALKEFAVQNIYLDLETIPSQSAEYRAKVRGAIKPPATFKKQESIDAWIAEHADAAADEAVSATSFDPGFGHICTIGYAVGDGLIESLHATTVTGERYIIETFFDALPKMGMACFIGHNIANFDLRFVLCRAIVLGIRIPTIIPRDIKPWSQDIFDTMTAWAGVRKTISLDKLCEAFGLPCKGDFDGSMVAQAWANGEHERIAEYCKRDVEAVRQIHKRFLAVGY
jgi:DNA polymerase elongation subunit (family B)